MKKYKDVLNICVMNKKNEKTGIVQDALVDFEKLQVYSYIIKDYSLFESVYIAPLDKITAYRENEIEFMDDGIFKIKKHCAYKNNFLMSSLINKNIVNTDNDNIGTLTDLIFDENSGRIKALVSSSGIFEDIFTGRRIIITNKNVTVNKKEIIISSEYACVYNDIILKKYVKDEHL